MGAGSSWRLGSVRPEAPARVVVLGGGGFVGGALAAALTAAGVPVVAPSSGALDLTAADAGARLAARVSAEDAVVMLSAVTPDKARDGGIAAASANLRMGEAACAAVRTAACRHVVYVSSDAVYGPTGEVITEATPAAPASLYGASHRLRELMLEEVCGPRLAVLRLTQVYGAADTHSSYGPCRMARSALAEGRIRLFGEGEERRDHIAVEEVVEVLMRTLNHAATGLLNVVTGRSVSFAEVAQLVQAEAGPGVAIDSAPRQVPVSHRAFGNAALQAAFPDRAAIGLADGVAALVRDLRRAGPGRGR